MSGRKVFLSPRAEADLDALADWIAENGSPITALDYIARIRRYISGFDKFPERGRRHDTIKRGLRAVSFERRVTITFVVRRKWVEVERVFYGGRNWRRVRGTTRVDD
ncbi:MAG: type II toxin-antitoxin system RelE/ParE family toxin [Devosia sp.]|nr:type II toxin-antitoxin system RelE/ParE family toxin [Devosia sp.]